MESLGDILKRFQQRRSSAAETFPAEWLAAAEDGDAAGEPPCPICGGRGWVRRNLPSSHPDFGRAVPCSCQEMASDTQRLERLQRLSNLGALAHVRLDATDPRGPAFVGDAQARFAAALDGAKEYAEDPEGWFVLIGGNGLGKTHLAAGVANRCIERGVATFFAFVPDLLDHLRSAYNPENELTYDELFELVKQIPLLVLDDLGTHSSTAWAEEKLFQLLNHRHLAALPTVVTVGVPLERLDERTRVRLLDVRLSRIANLGANVQTTVHGIGSVEPEMLHSMHFEDFDPKGAATDRESRETLQAALEFTRSYAQDPHGWLVLVGDSGCGKTHLAVAVANERLLRGEDVFFAFVPDLLDHLRYTFNPDSHVTYDDLFEHIKQTPLLILDDLGAESSTAWANEKLYQIIVHRHNAKLPTIITTRALPSGPNDPVASRLNAPRLVVVMPIDAPDYRQQWQRPSSRRPRQDGQPQTGGRPPGPPRGRGYR